MLSSPGVVFGSGTLVGIGGGGVVGGAGGAVEGSGGGGSVGGVDGDVVVALVVVVVGFMIDKSSMTSISAMAISILTLTHLITMSKR